MIEKPCFLVGAERSGTTMLRLMLAGHPQIAWSSEFEYAVDFLPEAGGWPELEDYRHELSVNRVFRHQGFSIDPTLDYPALVDSFLEQARAQQGGRPILGATVHRHFDRLTRIWPDARFIHILRDGRDVARSTIVMGWAGNMWTGIGRWIDAELTWAALEPTLTPDRFVHVRYEDLVRDPEGELARLAAFLGVAYHPAMLDYASGTQTYERPDPKLIGQWRTKVTPEEVRLAEARAGGMLAERGYEPSGLPPLEVAPALRRHLERQDYWHRVRRRWKSLGPRLFLESYVARRVGPRPWQARVQHRINALTDARLRR
jgi:hypothetical protein